MPIRNIIRTEFVCFGAGVAGLCTAFEASKKGLNTLILDDGNCGATHSATGIFDARTDHLPYDKSSVEITARELSIWKSNFPDLLKAIQSRHFLMPMSENSPAKKWLFEKLFEYYQMIATQRFVDLPEKYSFINSAQLEKMEPNLRKNYFEGAFKFWLWTIDPDTLMQIIRIQSSLLPEYPQRILISRIIDIQIRQMMIYKIIIEDNIGNEFEISGKNGPLVVVNSTGAWINKLCGLLNIKTLDTKMQLGVQASVGGFIFQSGIINFTDDKKYLIYLQRGGHLQVGPTMTNYAGDPSDTKLNGKDMSYLLHALNGTLDTPVQPSSLRFLKAGIRIKPNYIFDTDRPIIWHHANDGIVNFYTALPGKMVLGFLMARELMRRIDKDRGIIKSSTEFDTDLSLAGDQPVKSQLRLVNARFKSSSGLGFFLSK